MLFGHMQKIMMNPGRNIRVSPGRQSRENGCSKHALRLYPAVTYDD